MEFLGHQSTTDVITFDYLDDEPTGLDGDSRLVGEIFVCPDVAAEAASRHGNRIGKELTLYLVHAILHLAGHEDSSPAGRRAMRRAEAQVMARIADELELEGLVEPIAAAATGPSPAHSKGG